jgi:hypothetical protein
MKEIGVSGAQVEEIYALDAHSLRAMRSTSPLHDDLAVLICL